MPLLATWGRYIFVFPAIPSCLGGRNLIPRVRYLSAWQDVGVGLYPGDDLAKDNPVREHIHLRSRKPVFYGSLCSPNMVPLAHNGTHDRQSLLK